MGNENSGRYHGARWRCRPVAEQLPQLHIAQITALVYLAQNAPKQRAGAIAGWSAGDGDRCAELHILITIDPAHAYPIVDLVPGFGVPGGRVALDTTALHPGTPHRRWWLRCPRCDRRCAVLYALHGAWCCRTCGRITYTSSNRSDARYSAGTQKYFQTLGAMVARADRRVKRRG